MAQEGISNQTGDATGRGPWGEENSRWHPKSSKPIRPYPSAIQLQFNLAKEAPYL